MGIDLTALETILFSLRYVKNNNNLLTLARQQIHTQNITLTNNFFIKSMDYCENLFKSLGFLNIESIDNSSYENATIIHNLNTPYNNTKKYDYIYDGGTTEHIFNIPQVFENIINLLEIDGIFCSVTVNNNFSGHGFYQFSPELYLSMFTSNYGMKIQCIYLAKVGSKINEWIKINNYDNATNRINTKFNGNEPVYIIVIAKKINNTRQSLLINPPNQYSYKIDWKNKQTDFFEDYNYLLNRNEIVKKIVSKINNGVFVEIGTHSGNFADEILSNSVNSILYCVDPYIKYDDYKDSINNITGDELFNSTKKKLINKYGERVKFIRDFSKDAVDLIPNNIDFLYIDGNHQYNYVYEDLELYFPKVKKGGIIVGDDAVDTNESIRNENKNIYIEWSPGCSGEYGVIKAFTDFKETNNLIGKIITNQYLLIK